METRPRPLALPVAHGCFREKREDQRIGVLRLRGSADARRPRSDGTRPPASRTTERSSRTARSCRSCPRRSSTGTRRRDDARYTESMHARYARRVDSSAWPKPRYRICSRYRPPNREIAPGATKSLAWPSAIVGTAIVCQRYARRAASRTPVRLSARRPPPDRRGSASARGSGADPRNVAVTHPPIDTPAMSTRSVMRSESSSSLS